MGLTRYLHLLSVGSILVVATGLGSPTPYTGPRGSSTVPITPTYHFVAGARWTFHLVNHNTFLVLPHHGQSGRSLLNEAASTSQLQRNGTIRYMILGRVPGGALVQAASTPMAMITRIDSDGVPFGTGPRAEITEGFWWTIAGVGLLPDHPATPRLRWSSTHPVRLLIEDLIMPTTGAPSASALTVSAHISNVITSLTPRRMIVSTTATLLQHDVSARYNGRLARSIVAVHAHVESFAYRTVWVFDLARGWFVSGHATLHLRARSTYIIPHQATPRVRVQNETAVIDMRVT